MGQMKPQRPLAASLLDDDTIVNELVALQYKEEPVSFQDRPYYDDLVEVAQQRGLTNRVRARLATIREAREAARRLADEVQQIAEDEGYITGPPYTPPGPQHTIKMGEDDILAARLLNSCTFLPGSWNKRFARALHNIANSDKPHLTSRQFMNLWRLVWRYRRQIDIEQIVEKARRMTEAKRKFEQERDKRSGNE